ncbi:MAG: helix-turn-helix domain-containing protein [Kineosporiaceae bacterium]|nr:helix-turn-helix domain-containing protein [Aeromicrobium sp.]
MTLTRPVARTTTCSSRAAGFRTGPSLRAGVSRFSGTGVFFFREFGGAGTSSARVRWDNAGHGYTGSTIVGTHTPHALHRFTALTVDAPDRIPNETPPPMTDDDSYWAEFPDTLTTADTAKILRVGKATVLVRLKTGAIPGHLVVGSWVIFKAEIRAWLDTTSNQTPTTPAVPVDVLAGYEDEMSYRDLMVLLGKSKQTIYSWLHNGDIPAFHIGTRWIIRKDHLRHTLIETSNQPHQDS